MPEHGTYLGNPLLKSAYVPQDFSEEQVGEYVRCQQDPLYFVNEHVKIVSVDVVEGCHDPDVDDWLNDYEEKERIDIRVDNSWAMETVPISLLFVDGDHSYEGVKKDFIHHWNYLNGPCLCHDYTDPDCEGVTKFINEWIEEGYIEIIEQVGTMVALKRLKNYEV